MGTYLMEEKVKPKRSKIGKFYRSDRWHDARRAVIRRANGRCEKCGAVGTEVHHIVHLTNDNVDDPKISINLDNLILLCKECHNKIHGRFEGNRIYEFDKDGNLVKTDNK